MVQSAPPSVVEVTLAARVDALERRVVVLEQLLGQEGAKQPAVAAPAQVALAGVDSASMLPLFGRTLLALGGGFLLRALTESGQLRPLTGTLVGLAYALVWWWLAHRDATARRYQSALFNGIGAAALLYPLLWEAVVHFRALTAVPTALLLATTTTLGLLVAWRHRLHVLAWVVALGATAASLALAYATREPATLLAALLWVGFLTLWLGYSRGFVILAWLEAALLNLATVILTLWYLASVGPASPEAPPATLMLALQLGLIAVYVGSIAWRTLVERVEISVLEMGQAVTAVVVGFGGALLVANATSRFALALGLGGLAVAGLSYGVAFVWVARQSGHGRNFRFYSAVALALSLLGLVVTLSGALLAAVCCALGVVTGALGARWQRVTLSGHAAAYLLAAALAGGMLGTSWQAMTGSAPALSSWWWAPILALVTALVCSWYHVQTEQRVWGALDHLPKLLLLTTTVVGIAGLLATNLLTAAVGIVGGPLPPPVVAAMRTAVLAGAPPTLALLSRSPRFTTARWLIYPVLAAGAVKLLAEDVRLGTTWSLFFSLVIYGGAVSITPRLLRQRVIHGADLDSNR
ncbi:MAG: hypothetical protein AAB426_01365 [Myxococcota bacterium]